MASQSSKRAIVLGITGGIAAYKAAELVRLLIQQSYSVQVVMTEAACQFITPVTMQALSGNPVYMNMWDNAIPNGMPHIELSRQADAILIAPASADFLAKLVHGRADDLLSTLCLARNCPLLVAPAMNKQMWENPATQRNISQLKADGISILGPAAGEQACGEIGLGRMLEPEALMQAVTTHFTPKLLQGKRILITAGATLEPIDPVRAITNLSSGKMGYAIAQVAVDMGAAVTLVSGHSTQTPPSNLTFIKALDAKSMYQTVMQQVHHQDVLIAVAAVADYSPAQVSTQKIKKSEDTLSLTLLKNKDILADVASLPNAPFCIGFAAETEHVIKHATQKRIAKKLPLIVANDVSIAMGQDHNQVTLIDDAGSHALPLSTKPEVALLILQHLASMLK
ncbi:phosphopantothenoylcysteine decarboxylase/phosphopantothenate--cysteine ligase [Methylophilaceae bacterium 11]|jgi:phosphopantothenoylcysteine decarboxylase/phosphopantothenate--cysteine ligase|uniref:bifunctional phosphopantothenoylcysteine decarboxylase/phosphopantothenate--cysteine ligase CoaBC n=1 Tax=Methylotenera sp. N17 TaxID=1502761 RepID=UPI0004453B65|nr:bifunctional phosphopantothenoylcysteine decarboxylase/phosphopantothenate--cysteine ligase CoaBC [Methylotenera sp. N17]EUJ09608.1 phosphopantothenoylcysteine decarboxylase/phosphopantothenate--cysteine ligase [Methylophilaceae bacterium 11]